MREVTITESTPLKRTMRFRLEHIELLPDLHFYERRMERGFTTDGTDFIARTFVNPDWMEMQEMPMAFAFGHLPRRMQGGWSCYDDEDDSGMKESGLVTSEGLEAVKAAGMEPLKKDPRLGLGVIDQRDAEVARNHGANQIRLRKPTMKDWQERGLKPEHDLYREVQASENGHSHGHFYTRLDGSALPVALKVHLSFKNSDNRTGHYGCYDDAPLLEHLKALQEAGRVTFERNCYDHGSFRVTWRPLDQAEFDLVWNAAEQKEAGDATKNVWDTLIERDLLGLAQFKCEPPAKHDPKVKEKKKAKIKSRIFRVTNSLTGTPRWFFAKNAKGALDLAVHFKHVTNPDDAHVEDDAGGFPNMAPPLRAMEAGLIGSAYYVNDGAKSGWEAVLDGKVTRIWDKDAHEVVA